MQYLLVASKDFGLFMEFIKDKKADFSFKTVFWIPTAVKVTHLYMT